MSRINQLRKWHCTEILLKLKLGAISGHFIRQLWAKHLANLVVVAFSGNKGQLARYLDEKQFVIKSHRQLSSLPVHRDYIELGRMFSTFQIMFLLCFFLTFFSYFFFLLFTFYFSQEHCETHSQINLKCLYLSPCHGCTPFCSIGHNWELRCRGKEQSEFTFLHTPSSY